MATDSLAASTGDDDDGVHGSSGEASAGAVSSGESGASDAPADESGDDGAAGSEGGVVEPPTMAWRTFSLTCPEVPGLDRYESVLVDLARGVPGGAAAHSFVHVGDVLWLNPSGGAASRHDEAAQTIALSCGNGNGLGTNTVRVAMGYPDPAPDTVELRWDVREVQCPHLEDLEPYEERAVELATGIDPGFVSAHYMSSPPDASTWAPKPGSGRGSHLTLDGALMVACGLGNAHDEGSTIRAAFGYPADDRPDLQRLRWETYTMECPEYPDLDEYEGVATLVAEGIDPDFVVGSYSTFRNGAWSLNPLTGGARVDAEAGEIYVSCGNGSALEAGVIARVALAYPD